MLRLIRKAARSWVAGILIGLLVISFGIWGINDVFTGGGPDGVAKVAGQSISQTEYRAEFDRLLKRAKEETKRDVTMEEARKEGLDSAVLERIVGERAFSALTESLGIRPALQVVQAEISKIPGFQDPTTRRFSQDAYLSALQENGYTPEIFERTVRTDLARQTLTLAASSGFRAPNLFARQTLAFGTERREVSIIPIAAALAGAPRTPTEAELKAFYDQNKAALTRPETRALTVAVASLKDFEARASVDETQARQIFDSNKARLSTPAKRSLVQLVAPDRAKADQAAAQLRAGTDPAAIAKALGLSAPVILNDVTPTGVPDEAVSKAAFAAEVDDIQVIAAKLQPFAAFKVTKATPGVEARFEESAAQIRTELRTAAAGELLTDATDAFDQAIADGATLEAAAAKAGLAIVKVSGIVADGRDPATGQPVALFADAPEVLRSVFGAGKGDVTDLATLPGDRYVAVRVDAVTPSAPPPLEQVKTELAVEWTRQDISKRLKARADTIAADARKSGFDVAARSAQLPVLRQPQALQRGQGGPQLSEAIFSAKKGDIVVAPTANGVEYVVARIDAVLRDNEAKVPERVAQAETAVRQSVQRDLVASLERVARDRAKAQLFPDMMKRALGDTPETSTDAGAKAPAPKTP
jgi:peptidyl-prolyl cis-trans isomerase D